MSGIGTIFLNISSEFSFMSPDSFIEVVYVVISAALFWTNPQRCRGGPVVKHTQFSYGPTVHYKQRWFPTPGHDPNYVHEGSKEDIMINVELL